MTGTIKITLGGAEHEVKQLVWRQIREVAPAFSRLAKMRLEGTTEAYMDQIAEVVKLATGIKPEDFNEMPVSQKELREALKAIAKQAGLKEKEDDAPGEDPAAGEK